MLLLRFEWADWCALHTHLTVYPKTHNASPPKTHASRLPVESASYQLTLQAHCVITHPLIYTRHPSRTPPSSPLVYAYALRAVVGY